METMQSQWGRSIQTSKSIEDVSMASEHKTSGKLLAQNLQ